MVRYPSFWVVRLDCAGRDRRTRRCEGRYVRTGSPRVFRRGTAYPIRIVIARAVNGNFGGLLWILRSGIKQFNKTGVGVDQLGEK
jgi:hypothetical protein